MTSISLSLKPRGFTLIELLIVITILGVLAGMIMTSYGKAQEKSRDSRRKTDVDAIRKSLELAKQDTPGAYYYPVCTSGAGTICAEDQTTPSLIPTYLPQRVADPKTNLGYTYSPTGCVAGGCTTYTLIACLENGNDPQGVTDATNCPTTPQKAYSVKPS